MQTNGKLVRALGALTAALIALVVAGCGGGGGSSSNSGSGGNGSGGTTPVAANQVAITVARGTSGAVNIPTVSVTICAPGTTTCQTIDNIQVDTMSYGLRIVNTAAATVLGSLPIETDASGNQIAECTVFADGFTWGSVRKADVTIGSKTAGSLPIAIVGDMGASTVPTACSSAGAAENTVSALGANGILGIGVAPYDCGAACVSSVPSSPSTPPYYVCPNGANCTATTMALAQQVTTPVVKFASDNNGVVLTMAPVSSGGQATATGTITFGINTQTNNALTGATTYGTDGAGDVNATVNGAAGFAFFDSGSNGFFFNDTTLAKCASPNSTFYCPSASTTRSVPISNASGSTASTTVTMAIANANTIFTNSTNNGWFAFDNLGGDLGFTNVVDFGMPFFYGRTVFFGYDQTASGAGTQTPYVAF